MTKLTYIIILCFFSISINMNSQTTYQLNFMEVYRNNQIISKGAIDEDKLIIDENGKKISIVPVSGYKTQIFRILNKTSQDDDTNYFCEMRNPQGTVQLNLFLNKFYKYLKCVDLRDPSSYVKYYFK
jgi:hypothetical protein